MVLREAFLIFVSLSGACGAAIGPSELHGGSPIGPANLLAEPDRAHSVLRLFTHASVLVQSSSSWLAMPTYWQALALVAVVVVAFLVLWGCAYCCCNALNEKAALYQARKLSRKRRKP